MAMITFGQIHTRVAEHYAHEAANQTPAAVACQALDMLREALAAMSDGERGEFRDEVDALVGELDEMAWASMGAALTTREG